MFKRRLTKTQVFVYAAIDIATTILAWTISYLIRFYTMENTRDNFFGSYIYYSFALALFVVFFASMNHLYEQRRYFPWYKEFLLAIKTHLLSIAVFIIFVYYIQPNKISRITIGLYAGIGPALAVVTRGIMRSIMKWIRIHGMNLRHVVVIGSGKSLNSYVKLLIANPERGIRFIGWVTNGSNPETYGIPSMEMKDIPHEGSKAPDSVIIGYDSGSHQTLDDILEFFNKTPIHTLVVPDIENAFIGYTVEEFHGSPMISINAARLTTVQAFIKRLIDIIGSLLGLVVLSPLLLLVALIIKITSNGPVLFGQERMTRDGKTFRMWKFRSMYVDSEENGVGWTIKDDKRCTRIGKILRSMSFDELPQLWNVLKGEMSLVGPRPEQPAYINIFKKEIQAYMLRHRMKSGITGWAQVNGWRGDTSIANRIECDLYYIRNWSLILDIKILLLTLIKGLIHENAY